MAEHIANIEILCPQCQSSLKVQVLGDQLQPEDRIVCPVHGDIGSYAEFEPTIKEAVAEEGKRLVKAMLDEALRGSRIKRN